MFLINNTPQGVPVRIRNLPRLPGLRELADDAIERDGPTAATAAEENPIAELLRSLRPFPRLDAAVARTVSSAPGAPSAAPSNREAYHDQAHTELVDRFRDSIGYVAMYKDGAIKPDGEATLYTALAVVALSAGNYHQDAWELANANERLAELLTVLIERSWGNPDGRGREHPIRHPDLHHYDLQGNEIRKDPLTKDSFAPIVAASYYAYMCPHSNSNVRELARRLIRKWSDYLVLNQWLTHSNYIAGEFDAVPKKKLDPSTGQWQETNEKAYEHIFGRLVHANQRREERQVDFKGPEFYFVFPHEIYALQNVAAKLGVPLPQSDIWSNEFVAELKQTMADWAAPAFANAAGRGLEYILQRLGYAVPYSIPLGPPDWDYGKVEGVFEVRIPAGDRERIVRDFTTIVRDFIKESVRLGNFREHQTADLVGIAIDRVLDFFPNSLGPDKWRSVLVGGLRQVMPWLSNDGWVEAVTFLATLQLLKTQKPHVVSYTLWAYAVECETRPELEDILRPFVQEFFGFLRENGNPNGLWAWLAEDTGRVQGQMALFDSREDQRIWSTFAFTSPDKFDDWMNEGLTNPATGSGKEAPRLDYLLLRALDEKGAPRGLTDVLSDWWHAFVDAVGNACQAFINGIKDQFLRMGQYTRDALDADGNLIRETWTSALEYAQEQWGNGRMTLKRVWDRSGTLLQRLSIQPDGKWIEEYWNRTTEKYWRGLWDRPSGSQLELFREFADQRWEEIYFAGRDGFKYWRGLWNQRTNGTMLEWFRTYANDQWEEIYQLGRDGFKYWRGLWNQRTNGTMLEWFRTYANDQWEEIYFAGRGAEKYWRGLWDRAGSGATQLQRFRTLANDQWEEIYFAGRDGFKYWRGLWNQRTNGTMLEWFRTYANDQWEEIYQLGRDGFKYWRGLWNQRTNGTMLEWFRTYANDQWEEILPRRPWRREVLAGALG